MSNRRHFLGSLAALAGAVTLTDALAQPLLANAPPISCNQYTWYTFYGRAGKEWGADLDASMADFAKTGIPGFEPSFNTAAEVTKLGPYLKKYNREMRSLYVNSTLHKADEVTKSIASVLAIADAAKPLGARFVVTNPSPIKWGGPENKTDAELMTQARALDELGAELRKRGMTLAYHTHDIEMRNGAREFHHMLLATDPKNVSFCLDVHWIYRGSGNSQVALFDVVKLYGKRISELHVRQSQNGVWSEVFTGTGDIDYLRLVRELKAMNVHPHIVLEQCLEKGSPNTLDAIEAHKQDLVNATQVFAGL